MVVKNDNYNNGLKFSDPSFNKSAYSTQQGEWTIEKTLTDWKEKGYTIYKGELGDIPSGVYIRYITKDNKIRNGGVVLQTKEDDKYFFVSGYNRIRFSVSWDNIKQLYVNHKQLKEKQQKQIDKIKMDNWVKKEEENDETKPKVIIPSDDKLNEILKKIYYEYPTLGRDKLFKIVKQENPNMKITRARVEKWLKNQELYQLTKPTKKSKGVLSIRAKEPFNIVEMDLIVKPDIIILNMIDVFSRMVYSKKLTSKKANIVLEGIKFLIKKMDKKPKMLISDNGKEFQNTIIDEWCDMNGIKQQYTTANTSMAHIVERFNKTLFELLEKKQILNNKEIKQRHIDNIVKQYNNKIPHTTIGMTPKEALKEDNWELVIKKGIYG